MRSAAGEPDPAVEKIRELEERLDKFRISADSDITYRGSAWQGYAFNIPACEGTEVTPSPGACCLPDGTCETVTPGQCLLDGGTFIGGSCTPNPCTGWECPDILTLPAVHVIFAGIVSCGCTTDGSVAGIVTPLDVNGTSIDLAPTIPCWSYVSATLPANMASEDFWFNPTCSGPPDITVPFLGANITFCCNGDGTVSLLAYFGNSTTNPFFYYPLQPTSISNGMILNNQLVCTGAPPAFVNSGTVTITW